MKLKFTLLFTLFTISIWGQRTLFDYQNETAPICNDCIKAFNKRECYILQFEKLILSELKKHENSTLIGIDEIAIRLYVETNMYGESKILEDHYSTACILRIEKITHNATTCEPF